MPMPNRSVDNTSLPKPIHFKDEDNKSQLVGSLDLVDHSLQLHGWFSFLNWSFEMGNISISVNGKEIETAEVCLYRADLEAIAIETKNSGFCISLCTALEEISTYTTHPYITANFFGPDDVQCASVDISNIFSTISFKKNEKVKVFQLTDISEQQSKFSETQFIPYIRSISSFIVSIEEQFGLQAALSAAYYLLLDRPVDKLGFECNLDNLQNGISWFDIVSAILSSEEANSKQNLVTRNIAILDSKKFWE